jgi:glycosyltransferase involved in cell wall biosynthesis
MAPKISIIIPCYNHGKYIKEAIQSVEECGDKSLYEIIILNDGSTDTYTIQILQELSEKRYNVINQANKGLANARNNAIEKAKGEYILALDSDNKILPEYLYESIKILEEKPDIVMTYGDSEYFGEKTGRNNVGDFNLQKLMLGNYIDTCAVFRKSVWETLGGYDENMPVMGLEDWDFWLNMCFNGYKVYYIPKVLFHYRISGNSMLANIKSTKPIELEDYINNKYRKYLNHNYINEVLLEAGKNNKKLAFKFLIALYFPRILDFLFKKKIIKSPNIF